MTPPSGEWKPYGYVTGDDHREQILKTTTRVAAGSALALTAFAAASMPAQASVPEAAAASQPVISGPGTSSGLLQDIGILNGGIIDGPLITGPLVNAPVTTGGISTGPVGPFQFGQFQ
ncbi:hypothetical protein ACRQ5B_09355 [Pseudarthrobacter sp. L19]|uniref:hypothetical protein n=1 Tax=Pseudarthrobacter sp. L19 TaxID=3423951 RepID=UPI003D79F099